MKQNQIFRNCILFTFTVFSEIQSEFLLLRKRRFVLMVFSY